MRKILLVSGCSMTDKNFVSFINPEIDTSYSKWPELIAKKLDMDCINLGLSGAGNEYIYSSLLEKIIEKKDQIGLVIPAWSQCQREDYQEWNTNLVKRVATNGDVFGWLKKSLRYFISLQLICERYNIPYKQLQMIPLYTSWIAGLGKSDMEIFRNKDNPNYNWKYTYPGDRVKDEKKLEEILFKFEPYINVKDFIGWPTVKKWGGYNIEEKVIKIKNHFSRGGNLISSVKNIKEEFIKDYILSEWDHHPNAKGHEQIAEFIYERL